MPPPVKKPPVLRQPLHLLIVAPDEVRTLIQDEYSGWALPRFWFTSFTESRLAMRYVSEAECPVIDLAIVELNWAGRTGFDRLLETLRSRFPDCATIVSRSTSMEPPQHFTRGDLCEVVEAPVEMAELVAATAQLSRSSKGALSGPRGYAALRLRALKLLKDQLLKLREDRSSVEHAIHSLLTRQACGERTPLNADAARDGSRKSPPRLSVYWRGANAHDSRAR
jgi:hypothetical protein